MQICFTHALLFIHILMLIILYLYTHTPVRSHNPTLHSNSWVGGIVLLVLTFIVPVNVCDVTGGSLAYTDSLLVRYIVDINKVLVRGNGKIFTIYTRGNN